MSEKKDAPKLSVIAPKLSIIITPQEQPMIIESKKHGVKRKQESLQDDCYIKFDAEPILEDVHLSPLCLPPAMSLDTVKPIGKSMLFHSLYSVNKETIKEKK